ncbi:hypothetical protein [Microbacterium sp. SYP-A9085]|uniref:hypothetical protein n=1 Tax=Microbacterium sp. SYP-A9085 TaxID=2664454 RepID=UPI00156272DD|nr:hypothetical protein [Microbacterium sp. SYP-A9085]
MARISARPASPGWNHGRSREPRTAVQPYQEAVALLEDYQSVGDSFRITKVNCY